MPKTRKIIVFCLIGVVCAALIVVYSRINPESSPLFPRCPSKLLTSIECPGCGSQRALHHLLNFRIANALAANTLLVLSIPYIFLLFLADLLKTKRPFFARLHRTLHSTKAIWAVFAVVVLWWIGRNLFVFFI